MSRKASSFWQAFEQDAVIEVHVGTESPRPKDGVLLEALPLKGDRGDWESEIMSYIGSLKELGALNLDNQCLGSRNTALQIQPLSPIDGNGVRKKEDGLENST